MKEFLLYNIFIIAVFFMGCSVAGLTSYNIERNGNETRRTKKFNMQELIDESSPRFIDKTLDNIEFPSSLTSHLSYKDKIVVMNLDRLFDSDKDQKLVVDRFLIGRLIKNNYVVLDRDENSLKISLLENSSRICNYFRLFNDSTMAAIVNTSLQAATRILAYRILELGIIKSEVKSDKKIDRYGIAELELRLIDAGSGQLLYSGIVKGSWQDEITMDNYDIVKDLHFKFENDALPLSLNLQPKEWLKVQYEITSTTEVTGCKLNFILGTDPVQIFIKNSSAKIVKSFIIPSNANQAEFVYSWDLTDNEGKKIPQGNYSIYINDVLAKVISF